MAQVYFANSAGVFKVPLTGGAPVALCKVLFQLTSGLAVDEQALYWTWEDENLNGHLLARRERIGHLVYWISIPLTYAGIPRPERPAARADTTCPPSCPIAPPLAPEFP